MKQQLKLSPFRGYMLLPPSLASGYYGVDRNPFGPTLNMDNMDSDLQAVEGDAAIWRFYPPGWRRDAYRLFEEHVVPGTEDLLLNLLSNLDTAKQIQRLIEPYIGFHEIVACEVWDIELAASQQNPLVPDFLGYDVAYLGGDFYSAILNGLFVNPGPRLVKAFKSQLNDFGLFPKASLVREYLNVFRVQVSSEADSEFVIYKLELVQ